MRKSKIDKEIDNILNQWFFEDYRELECFQHQYLCYVFNKTGFDREWKQYWNIINTRGHSLMSKYINFAATHEKCALLRLLVVEDFKRYLKERLK